MASTGAPSRASCHVPSPTTGRPSLSAKPISERVPNSPADRKADVARARQEAVAQLAQPGGNRQGEERMGAPGVAVGKQPARDPAPLDAPPAGRPHSPAAPAAHED